MAMTPNNPAAPPVPQMPWWPEQASTFAVPVDLFYIFMILVSLVFAVGIGGVIVAFVVKYRQRDDGYRPPRIETSHMVEFVWSFIPLLIVLVMFFWGAQLYFSQHVVPDNALSIDVTGKQWMFKFQHPNGKREINALHVPVNKPVKLTMASEDVIHNVFMPQFRVKHDVLPGRYTYQWFQATKAGEYNIFCNQYCGTQHSQMIGKVIVMEPVKYQEWLAGYTGESPAKSGEALFAKNACNTCHMDNNGGRGPSLNGIVGTKVALVDGGVVTADKQYLTESILNPQAKIVAGYTPIMPSFQGILGQEEVNNLIAYIESLPATPGGPAATSVVSASPAAVPVVPAATLPPAAVKSADIPTTVVAFANPNPKTAPQEVR